MIDYQLLFAVLGGLALLLILILKFKLPAFISLLIASICVGLFSGMPALEILETMKEGMGSTLGFVAVVVGLGAMFGALLENAGGAEVLARYSLKLFGEKRASWALMITGFVVAIPVFFDVAFIILVPLIYALQRKTGKSILLYAIPLLAGLAITHTFIPPTPGPVAVADILDADLGWVIIMGFLVSIPTAILCGPLFGKYISKKIFVAAPPSLFEEKKKDQDPSVGWIFAIIIIPLLLIVSNTVFHNPLLGHPFTALIIANLVAWYALGIRKDNSSDELLKISRASFQPAGLIILLTGAGGVFKQMLINTGAGSMLANYFAQIGLPLLVLAIASGASILSHVNDSGFWLVSNYLGLDEKQTFRSWTTMTSILAISGFVTSLILSFFIP